MPGGEAPWPVAKRRFYGVAEVGLEPTHPCGYRILNPARLPIPPLGQRSALIAGPGMCAALLGLWGIEGFARLGPSWKGLDS